MRFALSVVLFACAGLYSVPRACAEEPAKEEKEPFEGDIVQEIDVRPERDMRTDVGTVLRAIRTRKGRPFSRKVWDEDWHRLEALGNFLNVRTTEPIPTPGGVRLAIDLIEKATISKIDFRGNKSVAGTKLLETIKSRENEHYDKGQVHLDKVAIEKFYEDKAFHGVKVDYEVETVSSHRQTIGKKELDVDDEVRVIFVVDEGSPVGVRIVHFEGNQAFSEAALRAVITTKNRRLFRAGDLKDEELDNDKRRLEVFYRRHGYMDVAIEKVDTNLSQETYWNWFRKRKRLAELIIHINEGPQYFTGTLTISGNTTIEREEILSVLKVKPGAVFSDLLLTEDQDKISDLYGEHGRVFTRAEPERKLVTDPERIKSTPNLYDVTWSIRESAEITLGQVITRGNTKTKDKVIIRQMELYPGEVIDTTKMKIAQQRLKNLGYFTDDLKITPEQSDNPEEANLVIDVTEKNTGEFNFGVGVSSVDSVVGNVKISQRDFDFRDLPKSWRDLIGGNAFVGAGETASLSATAGAKTENFTLSFFEPWAFDRPIRLGGSVFHTADNRFRLFQESNTGFTSTVGKRLWGPRWDGEVDYRFSYTTITQNNRRLPPLLKEQDGDHFLSSLTPVIRYDSRDSTAQASRGVLMETSVEFGGGPLLGSYNWVKPKIDLARYFTVYKLPNGQKHILELRGRAEEISAYGSTNEVPPFMRFYAGGIDTIRGFKFRTIAPLENRFQIGGKREVLTSAEYSLPLYEEIVRGSAFIDAGDVSDPGTPDRRTRITNADGIRASTGLGLSIRTPISPLPIRVYFSRVLKKNEQDQTKFFDFTFGTSF